VWRALKAVPGGVDGYRMSSTGPTVLLLEADAADALLIEAALGRGLPTARIVRATTHQEYLDTLDTLEPLDLVVAAAEVSGCERIEAFHLARARRPNVPFLFLSDGDWNPDLRALHALGIGAVLSRHELAAAGGAIEQTLAGHEPWADPTRLLAGHELLLPVTRQLSLAADLPALAGIVQAAALRLTGADTATFTLRADEDCHPLGSRAMLLRQPVVLAEAGADQDGLCALGPTPVHSAIAVPVRAARPVAAIGAYWSAEHEPDATQVRLLQALADSTAVGLETLDLRRRAETTAADRTAELLALTYAISHDLRSPIRHLEGFARILLQDATDLSPQSRHTAQRIHDAADQLREMVNGMLTLSRIGQSEVRPRSVDLAALARDVVGSLAGTPAPDSEPQRAGVVEFVSPATMPATGDPRLLQTVLQYLLGNAWKFTSRVPLPRVELGVMPAESVVGTELDPVYFVRDNGVGFEPASAGRLFGVFQRLHSGEEFPGIGIGLAAVKRIVDKHGGTVHATGVPEQGATIFFTLPGPRRSED
jgi:K+-sensing histidine kinase KdpD